MNEKDNVATLLQATLEGEEVALLLKGEVVGVIKTLQDIEPYHKISIVNLNREESVVKYGEIIGITTEKIKVGEYVHTHNVRSVKV